MIYINFKVLPSVHSNPIHFAFGGGGEDDLHGVRSVGGEVGAGDGEVGDAEHGQAVGDEVAAEENVDQMKL